MSDVEDFLDRVCEWPGPDGSGFTNLHWAKHVPDGADEQGQPKFKKIWAGKPFQTRGDFVGHLGWKTAKQADIRFDFYYCTSRQRDKKLDKYGKDAAVRSGELALGRKTLSFDLDVKPENVTKGYPTLPEAYVALDEFCKASAMPFPNVIVESGSGAHAHWVFDRELTMEEWKPLAEALVTAMMQHGMKGDFGCTTDAVRILRLPDTLNHKTIPPKPTKLARNKAGDFTLEQFTAILAPFMGARKLTSPATANNGVVWLDENAAPWIGTSTTPATWPADFNMESGGDGIECGEKLPLDFAAVTKGCAFLRGAQTTGGKDLKQDAWRYTMLMATAFEDGHNIAYELSKGHDKFLQSEFDDMWARCAVEVQAKPQIAWVGCDKIQATDCKSCAACPHLTKGKSPLHLGMTQPTLQPAAPVDTGSFADPYGEFVGPTFPLDVLPHTLANFVNAEHRAMGADPSAIAMAAVTAVAGSTHAETCVRVGDTWWEKPILWCSLVGSPSTLKSPIIDKVTKPLKRIDKERDQAWRQQVKVWKSINAGQSNGPKTDPPAKPARCIIMDATPEKTAELLSREPSGSLMVHDELAGFLGSFERYNNGTSSRAFYLQTWNGGTFLKDRVGKGANDLDAEIRVDNLALCVLGGIQPDKLEKMRDLTSDGLLQRFLPVLMRPAELADVSYPVEKEEDNYERLIRAVNAAPPHKYYFSDDARVVLGRTLEYLYDLEQVDGLSSALIGAIGKLKGYFARICLVLHVASHTLVLDETIFSPECRDQLRRIFGDILETMERGGAGIDDLDTSTAISGETAETTERILREFLLPHIFGLYDAVLNGGEEREKVRTIANFILASDKDRLRPSDITAGLRSLRGQPEHKIREWAGRFCAMGWLVPEDLKTPIPKAWLVVPGLREHFAERRKKAQAARAEAHAILKAGGSRGRSYAV